MDNVIESGTCRGLCKGERAANEGPAVWAFLGNGKRVLMCPCCNTQLIYRPVDFNTGAPNVIPGLVRQEYRFEDPICWYDTVVLKGLK